MKTTTCEKKAAFEPQTTQQAAALAQLTEFVTGQHGARAMTLAGYAGTGKTTLVGELVRQQVGHMRIAVAAPTHKAVTVLRDKIGDMASVDFATIHSLLGLRLKPQRDGTYRCQPEGIATLSDYDLVIVDECSMTARDLFARILSPAFQSVRLLFVGDPAQLPPVEDDQNASMAFSRIQHRIMLTDVCRQAADHPAIALSLKIRDAIEADTRLDAAQIERLCANKDADVLLAHGGRVTAFNWALYDLRAHSDTRILAFRNATVRAYNRDLHTALFSADTPFAVGENLMLNDAYEARAANGGDPLHANKVRLHNSEETTVMSIEPECHPRHPDINAWLITVKRDNDQLATLWMADDEEARQRLISGLFAQAASLRRQASTTATPDIRANTQEDARHKVGQAWAIKDAFADARHVYAMTVHKSQGSTFDTAIVDLDDLQRNRSAQYNQLLYVAATRPRYHLAFIA